MPCGHTDIHKKAFLYGVALFLTPFTDKIIPILFEDKWPSVPMTVGCVILGVIATAIGIRAYYDGSYERSKNGYLTGSQAAPPAKQPAPPVQPVVPPKAP